MESVALCPSPLVGGGTKSLSQFGPPAEKVHVWVVSWWWQTSRGRDCALGKKPLGWQETRRISFWWFSSVKWDTKSGTISTKRIGIAKKPRLHSPGVLRRLLSRPTHHMQYGNFFSLQPNYDEKMKSSTQCAGHGDRAREYLALIKVTVLVIFWAALKSVLVKFKSLVRIALSVVDFCINLL